MILIPSLSLAKPNCNKYPVQCQILKNNPAVENVPELAKHIRTAAAEHNIKPNLYAAILMQESAYKLDAKNSKCSRLASDQNQCVVVDFGMAQIHHKTAELYQFDLDKLLEDQEYSITAGAKVLSWFKEKYSQKEPDTWFCRYNTGTAKFHKIKNNCLKYIKLVSRFK